jgi:hypothetical protein
MYSGSHGTILCRPADLRERLQIHRVGMYHDPQLAL